jgi:rhodanese-related sulfurtransferase
MPAPTSISCEKLFRLIGTPHSPVIVDARLEPAPSVGLIPSSVPFEVFKHREVAGLPPVAPIVVLCDEGGARSHGVAALLRAQGSAAEVLEGGVAEWVREGLPLLSAARLPTRNISGQTVWVTRARPKVDRIACPWLIRRFVDPFAQFLFVPASEVEQVAKQFDGAPFDIEGQGVFWSHRGDLCTFDVMVDEFGLSGIAALKQLCLLVRGADTDRPDLAPQAAGLLAASLGLSRMYADDLAQLDAAMLIYDAFYRWARDATGEAHSWVSHQPKGSRA